MKTYTFLGTLTILLGFTGCDKDQQVVRQLDGEWRVSEQKTDGRAIDPGGFETTYRFERCRMRKENCNGRMEKRFDGDLTNEQEFSYSISEKGEKFKIYTDFEVLESDILEHSRDKFVFSRMDGNKSVETTLEPMPL